VEEVGSSMTHDRGPQAFGVVLKASQLAVELFVGGSQIPKMSSINLLKYIRFDANLGSIAVFSCCLKETVA
jgi:hypothetical protein